MLILFVYSCSCSSVLLLSFKLLHSGNPKKHTQPKICGYISEASKIVCPFWQVWGLGFSAWQHRVESWQVFALKRQSVNQYKSVLFYLYVLDRHFEWLSLSFVLSNIPSPRTDLASGEHWPAITDHGVIRDLKIHENDWTNLNQKKVRENPGMFFQLHALQSGTLYCHPVLSLYTDNYPQKKATTESSPCHSPASADVGIPSWWQKWYRIVLSAPIG